MLAAWLIQHALRDAHLSNSVLQALPIEFPEVHVLDAARDKPPRVARHKCHVFDLVW